MTRQKNGRRKTGRGDAAVESGGRGGGPGRPRARRAASPVPLRMVITVQGVTYVLVAGLWPLLDFASLRALVGPKPDPFQFLLTDLMVLVIGLSLLVSAFPPTRKSHPPAGAYLLATGTPLVFLVVEALFRDSLPPVYAADFAVQAIFLVLLAWLGLRDPRWIGDAWAEGQPREEGEP